MDKRNDIRVKLDIYLNKFVEGVPFLVRASDISEHGIFVSQLIEPELEDARIGLQFQLPGSREVIYAEGEVMRGAKRNEADGHGIRFTLLTERHRRMISEFVGRRSAA